MKFEISGTFKMGTEDRPFTRTIEADNEKLAREKTLGLLGSEHRVKRKDIQIGSIESV